MMEMFISGRAYADMLGKVAPHREQDRLSGMLFAPKVIQSPLFPYRMRCERCDGTGEGDDATYCRKCGGAGEIENEGVISEGGRVTSLIQNKLKPRFAPYFPAGLVRPPRMCRGLV